MPSIRFRLDDPSLAAISARVREEFGPDARILSAAEVRVGGIGGFFARRFVDVEVELAPVVAAPTQQLVAPAKGPVGLDALMAAADEAERAQEYASTMAVSTETEPFARLLDDLRSYVEGPSQPSAPQAPLPSAPTAEPGGLVAFVGLADDALVVARSMALSLERAEVCVGGSTNGEKGARIDDRRSAAAARARGVERESSTLLAYGLGPGGPASAGSIEALRGIVADQVWVVVDASRKPDDTAAWVAAVRATVPVHAMAIVHGAHTASPDSVANLGLRTGWSDAVG